MSPLRFHFPLLLAVIGQLIFAAVHVRAETAMITAGRAVTLTVHPNGTAPFLIQWFKDGRAVPDASSATHEITAFQASHAGVYSALISNAAGAMISDAATLALAAAPVFTAQPVSRTVAVGGAVTFKAVVSGSPAATYQWRRNGVPIAGATGSSYTIAKVAMANAGTYTLVATNSIGSTTSNGAVLTVTTPAIAPVFTTQPLAGTVLVGGAVTLSAAASGSPTPTYQWRKNGTAIPGATASSYAILGVLLDHAGTYSVVATNSAGSATSNGVSLTVTIPTVPPVFTTQPANRTVAAASTVTFKAIASGSPAPAYQWRKNGVNIAGATGSLYTIAGVTAANAGTYTVVATNSAGTATSANAVLTVTPAVVPIKPDFNSDGKADILWQNILTGEHRLWLMAGTSLASTVALNTATTDWDIVGTGDFNNDGKHDILRQNLVTREVSVWLMAGTSVASTVSLGVSAAGMFAAGTGDFDGDGRPDIVWQNTATSEYIIALMNGTTATGVTSSLGVVDPAWRLGGTGDFNGDGRIDILWENTAAARTRVLLMNGLAYGNFVELGAIAANWRIGGTGDFNTDGKVDVLWQNTATGECKIQLMNGTTNGSEVALGLTPLGWLMAN